MPKDLKLYQILNVDATAADAEITAAYNRLIAEHPESDPRHEEIVHAYSVLSDVERRAKYDVTGKTTRIRRSRKTASGTKLEKVRFVLNTVFLACAAVTVVLFLLQFGGYSAKPFYWACGISMTIKVAEYILRLIP
jgi:DnaJ-class molecular chaperone